ncbi:MAG: PrsW family intramembrane metalloprotease [Candidatus Terrybacteria bacterium]|nr:PrsW family intramembrane metalloprotease [Candidatus Terrybacteria bacterium]
MLLLSLIFALLPSAAWLLLFLHEDVHPEPNRLVIRAFIAGMLVTVPTVLVEGLLDCVIRSCAAPAIPGTLALFSSPFALLPDALRDILYIFLGIALVEETMKYLAVRFAILRNPSFDEPIDALLYLVIAALGFAAVENALTVAHASVQTAGFFGPEGIFVILGARSLSATLLHALASGIVGYALARAFFRRHPLPLDIIFGIGVATLVHGAYNGLVGGLFPFLDSEQAAVVNVVILLAATGGALIFMIRDLRQRSIRHRWRNAGDTAREIA